MNSPGIACECLTFVDISYQTCSSADECGLDTSAMFALDIWQCSMSVEQPTLETNDR
jgi:hypothetical protein